MAMQISTLRERVQTAWLLDIAEGAKTAVAVGVGVGVAERLDKGVGKGVGKGKGPEQK